MVASALRMAASAAAKPVGGLLRSIKNASPMDNLIRFGPEFGYAAMSGGLFAPENATLGERASMMGEDLAYGLGSSLLGQGIGRGVGKSRARMRMANLPPEQQMTKAARNEYRNTVNSYQTGGDILGQMGMVMLPRPVTQGVYEAAGERGNVQAQEIAETQRGMLEEQELMVLLGQLAEAGYLGGQVAAQRSAGPGLILNA